MASSSITSWQIGGETVADFIFLGSKITADGNCSHEIKTLTPWKESYDQPREHIQKQRHYFANKGLSSQSYGFSSSHVWMWELDYKESWAPKYWSFSFRISPSNEYSGLISFRMDWLDLLAVQGTLKSLLQHHSSKASILWCSAFFVVQLSHPYMTTRKTIALTIQTFVGKWCLCFLLHCLGFS